MSDKVTIIICDDEAHDREYNKNSVDDALKDSTTPYEFVEFNDGLPALDYMKTRGSAKGVILISDGSMGKMNGFTLFQFLNDADLLPANTMLCSSITLFKELMESVGVPPERVRYAYKDDVKYVIREWMSGALKSAAAEIGLSGASGGGEIPDPRRRPAIMAFAI